MLEDAPIAGVNAGCSVKQADCCCDIPNCAVQLGKPSHAVARKSNHAVGLLIVLESSLVVIHCKFDNCALFHDVGLLIWCRTKLQSFGEICHGRLLVFSKLPNKLTIQGVRVCIATAQLNARGKALHSCSKVVSVSLHKAMRMMQPCNSRAVEVCCINDHQGGCKLILC